MPLQFYNLLFINYAGCQDGLVLDRMKQELSEVEKNLTDMVSKIIGQVSSDQTEQRRWLEKKINVQTLELKEEIRASKENQTSGDEIKQLALKFQTWAVEVSVKVNFKEKRVKIVTKRITSFWKHHIYVNLIIAIINKDWNFSARSSLWCSVKACEVASWCHSFSSRYVIDLLKKTRFHPKKKVWREFYQGLTLGKLAPINALNLLFSDTLFFSHAKQPLRAKEPAPLSTDPASPSAFTVLDQGHTYTNACWEV